MKKAIKIVLSILAALVIIILVFKFSFGYLIKTQLKKFTNNSITLDYKSSSAKFLGGSIEFSDAILNFNDVSIDSNSSIFIKSLSFEKFAISRLNLKTLFFDRSFDIEKVLLNGPAINFQKDTTISPKDIFSKILTPQVLSTKSQSAPFNFEIGELEIVQGSFQLKESDKTDFGIGMLNLKLTNIGMDDLKALNENEPDYNANFNIRLGIYDIQSELEGDAKIIIDSVVYKKDKKQFLTGGIHLKQLSASTDFAKSEISLNTELVSVEGFSLSQLLSTNDLKFSKLTVSNTEIFEKLKYNDKRKVSENKTDSKWQVISHIVNVFITDTFNLQNFNYHAENMVTDTVEYIKDLNIWMYSVRVDSNFFLEEKYLTTIEKSFLLSGPISLHIPENGFDFSCDTLLYSGSGKEQKIGNLCLKTYPSMFSEVKNGQIFQLNADSLVISDLDESEWRDSSNVKVSVYMKNPQVLGTNVLFGNSKSNKSKPPVYAADKIFLKELNLVNGNINIEGAANEKINTELFNVNIEDLEVDLGQGKHIVKWGNIYTSIENMRVFVSENLMVELDKGVIKNNDLDFEGVLYTENPDIKSFQKLAALEIDSKRFSTEKVNIDNFDILAFINRKYVSIDNLAISKPKYFQFAELKPGVEAAKPDTVSPVLLYCHINDLLAGYVSYLNIRNFSVSEADIMYQMEADDLRFQSGLSTALHNIKFDKDLPEGGLPELTIDQYEFCINDISLNSDKIKVITESVCYSNVDDELIFTNVHADNLSRKKDNTNKESMEFNVTFPRMILSKPVFSPPNGGPVSFNTLHLVDPEIYLQIPTKKEDNNKTKRNDFKILPFTFLEDGLKLENGKVGISLLGETDTTIIDVSQVNLKANDIYKIIGAFHLPSYNNNLFAYLDFHLKDVSLKNSRMNLAIQHIDYDQQSSIISIDPINYKWFHKTIGPKPISLTSLIDIPGISIEQPDVMLVNEKVESFGAVNLLIPTVDITYESVKAENTKKNIQNKIALNDSSIRNFLGNIDFFHIDSTVINHIGITHHELSDSVRRVFNINRIAFLIDKLKIDSSHFDFHEKRIAKDINIRLYDKELVTADSMYRINIDNIVYYYGRDKIVIDSFEVIPMYNREEFFKKAVYQTDRMQVKFKSAVAEGIDLLSIIESKKLQINKLTFDKIHLMDHRDQHYARKENDVKELPTEMLFSLPIVLNVDTVKIKDSFFLYGEYVDKSAEPGEIYFANFDASIYNISNTGFSANNNDSLYAHITTDIMNESQMTVDLTFPLDKNDDNFWLRANVDELDLRKFNSMTENLFGITIARGKGGVKIPFIMFSDIHSEGSIIFKYDKLKLALYNRNKAKMNQGLGSGLVEFMLNGVLIKSNNPSFLGKTRTGEVYAKRNNQRSFFNYIWKSTMRGLMSTLGFNNKEQREDKKEMKVEDKTERKDERQMNKSVK